MFVFEICISAAAALLLFLLLCLWFQSHAGPLSSWTFISRHQVKGETWRHTEPVTIPLLSPKKCESLPKMNGGHSYLKCCSTCSLGMFFMFVFLKHAVSFSRCQRSYSSETLDRYSALLSDAVHSVPPDLLGDLLHEELTEQRDRLLFSEGATGGALAFVPFSQSCSDSQHGCLIYPRNQGLDCLSILQRKRKPGLSFSIFQLKGPVRQISSVSLLNQSMKKKKKKKRFYLQVFIRSVVSCDQPFVIGLSVVLAFSLQSVVSPHVLGEVLVASESGTLNLWTVENLCPIRMQKVREEDSNLYFNAKSAWRWCEFSAHPRVMLYADRTGVELTDIRGSPFVGHTLFRISNTSECRSGERLILSKYLGDAHCFHHLVTTQYSAYIMDERFPGVPMLKWDHYMQSPPMFCHLIPGSASSESAGGGAVTTKVLLGSHSSQEITLLQYSGQCPRSHCLQHLTVPVEGLLQPPDNRERDSAEEERVQSLRRDLRACMSRRSLLVHSAVSDSITAPDIKPVPDPVDTDTYMDQLSQRLTLSWQGEEAWRAWWEDSLGLNREKKVADLRRKRRMEKAAKRASGQRMELSGSFASSMSYQAELSDFSDSQGWAYATSLEALSEPESIKSQSEGIKESGTLRATTPSIMLTDGPDPGTPQSFRDKPDEQRTPRSSLALTLTQPQTLNSISQTDGPVPATPQSIREKPDEQQTPGSSLTQPQTSRLSSTLQTDSPVPATPQSVREKPDEQRTPRSSRILTLNQPQTSRLNSTTTSQRKNKRPAEDVLKSLFAPQVRQNMVFCFFSASQMSHYLGIYYSELI
uniref:Wu:fj64h06 n=1 Tax=Labrus bergylta TaxID=56723 RepID=A0A3Q3E375_9LABR